MAFVHIPTNKAIYVDPLVEFFPHLKAKVLKLKKALYGTCQASCCWWKYFKSLLDRCGFSCNEVEECIYKLHKGDHIIIIWLHFDDGVIFLNSDKHLKIPCQNLERSLRLKWLNTPDKIVGIKVDRSSTKISLSQNFLLDQILLTHDDTFNHQHIATHTPLTDASLTTSTKPPNNTTLFPFYIGSLNYLALGTCPDISHLVNYLA